MSQDALSLNAQAVAHVIRRALSQGEDTPEDDRMSFRVLAAAALPLLEQIANRDEVANAEAR